MTCPLCGERDRREFSYLGSSRLGAASADAGARRSTTISTCATIRPGPIPSSWQHEAGCRARLHVVRDTRDHTILAVGLAREAAR